MKKFLVVALVCCFAMGMIAAKSAQAWLFDAEVRTDVNSNSHNDSSQHYGDGSRLSSSSTNNSNNRYDNSRHAYDSHAMSNSANTYNNQRDDSVNDSFNVNESGDKSVHDNIFDYSNRSQNVGGDMRINSNNIAAGDIRNASIGDFNQNFAGTNFSSGINGSSNTVDASSVNVTTFGDTVMQPK